MSAQSEQNGSLPLAAQTTAICIRLDRNQNDNNQQVHTTISIIDAMHSETCTGRYRWRGRSLNLHQGGRDRYCDKRTPSVYLEQLP
ncbi:hypothetical protein J6590_097396 [Homalodisca vitripennis]|nr:hypothetical protein J6590_097396 [Homalodisca vitripennis]